MHSLENSQRKTYMHVATYQQKMLKSFFFFFWLPASGATWQLKVQNDDDKKYLQIHFFRIIHI